MKGIPFKHQTIVFAENQPQYKNLPALIIEGEEGNVVTCWKLSFWEKIRVLYTGKIWLNLMTFNNPLQPIFMSTKRKEVYSHPDDQLSCMSKVKKFWKGN